MPRIVCAGHVNWDVSLRVDRLPAPDGEASIESESGQGGGGAANVAAGLTSLGESVSLVGSVGSDERGREARRELAAAGVDCALVVEVAGADTAVKYVVVDDAGQVMVLGGEGANEAFDASVLPAATLSEAEHLHLTGQRPRTAAELARRASEAGVTVSFDPGRRIAARDFGAVLARADVLFCTDREAGVAGEHGAVDADQVLVVKRGAGGAEVRTGGETITHPGFAVDVVDTTGAGDAFAAGFVAAVLDGADYRRALAVGNAAGALATTVVGARPPLSWTRIEDLLAAE